MSAIPIGTDGDINSVMGGMTDLCPFKAVQNTLDNEILAVINWFVPVLEIVVMLQTWVICIGLWYGISVALRWLKAIQ
jgi:hypothetical protein